MCGAPARLWLSFFLAAVCGCDRQFVVGVTKAAAGGRKPVDAGSDLVPGTGNGLRAQYFSSKDLSGPPLTRIDPNVDFVWNSAAPDPAVPIDFSAVWTGQVEARYSETYTFHASVDDGARLWIDGTQLIDAWTAGPQELSGEIALIAGRRHDIRLEFVDFNFRAIARLFWSSPSQRKEIIPRAYLYPPP